MRSRLSFLLLALLPLSLLIACSVASIDVSAETVWRQMTIQETYAFYGDTIDCIYYSTEGYKHVTLTKSSNMYTWDFGTMDDYGQPSWIDSNYWVGYFATVNDFSSNPSYMQFNISPNVHFSDCTSVRIAAAAHSPSSISSAVYSPSICKLNVGTGDLLYSTSGYTLNGYYPVGRMHRASYFDCMPVWAEYDSNVLSTVNVLQFGFSGANVTNSGGIEIYLMAPFVNDGAVPGTGIVTETTSPSIGTDINVNVDVDLDETNSLLGDIISGIGNIFDDIVGAISSVFIPDDGYIENWADDMLDVIEDAYSDDINADVLKDALLDLTTYGSTTSLRFPGVDLTGCGINFVIPAQAVDLKPLNDNNIYDAIATLIDILATIAVFNMVLNRIHAVFVGEKVVEIDGD